MPGQSTDVTRRASQSHRRRGTGGEQEADTAARYCDEATSETQSNRQRRSNWTDGASMRVGGRGGVWFSCVGAPQKRVWASEDKCTLSDKGTGHITIKCNLLKLIPDRIATSKFISVCQGQLNSQCWCTIMRCGIAGLKEWANKWSPRRVAVSFS